MAQPIIIQEGIFRNYLSAFKGAISPFQWTYFVTVLMGMIHCQASRTLSGLLRSVATWVTVWQLSRFLVSPRWKTERLAEVRYQVFTAEVQPLVKAAHVEQRRKRVKRQGRYPATVVTGYLILDDSTHVKRYAQKMGGQGRHYSSTDKCTTPGHSLFQGVYLVEGNFDWNDLGSWESVYLADKKDELGNVANGDSVIINSSNSYVYSENSMVALVGLENVIVVQDGNTILVCNRDNAEEVKDVVDVLKKNNLSKFL